jgi:hypothetical protein
VKAKAPDGRNFSGILFSVRWDTFFRAASARQRDLVKAENFSTLTAFGVPTRRAKIQKGVSAPRGLSCGPNAVAKYASLNRTPARQPYHSESAFHAKRTPRTRSIPTSDSDVGSLGNAQPAMNSSKRKDRVLKEIASGTRKEAVISAMSLIACGAT